MLNLRDVDLNLLVIFQEILREKRISPGQLQEALNAQKANGGKLGITLVKLGMVKDEDITALLSRQYGVPSINLAQFEIEVTEVLATQLRAKMQAEFAQTLRAKEDEYAARDAQLAEQLLELFLLRRAQCITAWGGAGTDGSGLSE